MARQFKDEADALDFLHQALSIAGKQDQAVDDVQMPAVGGALPPTESVARLGRPQEIEEPAGNSAAPESQVGSVPGRELRGSAPQVGSVPMAPAGQGELAALQGFAERRRRSSALGQAGSNFADAFTTPGARTSNNFWDKWSEGGDTAVADYQARKVEGEATAKKAKADALEKALADPNSPESRQAVEMAINLHPNLGKYLVPGKSTGKQAHETLPFLPTLIKEGGEDVRATAHATAAKTAADTKQTEENRRRVEDRGQHVSDETGRRVYESGEHRLHEASQERAAALSAGGKVDESINRDVESLSKRLENTPVMKNDLATLQKFAERDTIPGVGMYHSQAPAWAPGIGQEDIQVRQAAKGVLGAIIKEQSGTAASEGEISRKLEELGMGPKATEEEFRTGLKRLIQNATDATRAKEAGYRPAAVEEARRRGMTTSADLPHAEGTPGIPAPTHQKPAPGAGWTRGSVKGRSGWVSADKTEFEAD